MTQTQSGPLTEAQLTKLWAAARELGMDSTELHDLVGSLVGKGSLRALTVAEAARIIDALVERGASSGNRRLRRLPPDVPRLVTPWQLERLANLIRELGWQDARPLYEGVLKRAIGSLWPRTSLQGSKAIEAFKAILLRRAAPREGQG